MYSIIGGGIAGLTMAVALEKLEVDYVLFERAKKLTPIGSGILLPPNALSVLEWLELLEAIKDKGSTMKRITLARSNLSTLFDYQQDDVPQLFGNHSISIHRWELQRILLEHIPKEKIRLGKTLESFEQQNDTVMLRFKDGSIFASSHMIGADGIHSKIRSILFPESSIRYSGQTCWRGLCALPENVADTYDERGIELWGEMKRFGISKIEKNRFYWFAVVLSPPGLKDGPEGPKQRLVNDFRKYHPIVRDLIQATDAHDIVRSDLYDLKSLKSWHHKNICLIGDAAHATTPNMGQGGAQGIEDAYFLSKTITFENGERAFAAFQNKRRRKATKIAKRSWIMGKMGHLGRLSEVRNLIFKVVPHGLLKREWRSVYKLE